MKKLLRLLVLFLFGTSFAFSLTNGREPHRYADAEGKIEYETKNNMYDGHYCSYYKNGNKKCEGEYVNNQKTGDWNLYDSTGALKIKRTYKNNFDFTECYSYSTKNSVCYVKNRIGPVVYNANGFINYQNIADSSIFVSKRIWRTIWADPTVGLFTKNKFIHQLVDSVIAGNYVAYSTDEMKDTCKGLSLARLLDTSNYKIAGYKIKEDWFYDKSRNMVETRIIAICPIGGSKILSDDYTQVDLGWFYFPQLRNGMAKLKVDHNFYPTSIKSLDDVFFFRYFYGEIYKESNINNREIASYTATKDLKKERERIEMSLFELEESYWLSTIK